MPRSRLRCFARSRSLRLLGPVSRCGPLPFSAFSDRLLASQVSVSVSSPTLSPLTFKTLDTATSAPKLDGFGLVSVSSRESDRGFKLGQPNADHLAHLHSIIYVYVMVPELKGRTLEEVGFFPQLGAGFGWKPSPRARPNFCTFSTARPTLRSSHLCPPIWYSQAQRSPRRRDPLGRWQAHQVRAR